MRDRYPAQRELLGAGAAAVILSFLAIVTIDAWVATTIAQYEPATFWNAIISKLEWLLLLPTLPWMSGIVLAVAMLASVFVKPWRWAAPAMMFLAGSHIIGRALTNYIKEWTGRLRPLEWIKSGAHDGAVGSFLREGGLAFPSGHVAIFASVIVPLVVLRPKLWPLLTIVAYVMVARVIVDAHWVSDVIGSVAVVALVTWACAWAIRPRRAA